MPKTLRLILGDQLNQQHSWFESSDHDVLYVMMEMRQETDYVKHHIQKVVAFFAAMRNFAHWLEDEGHLVQYLSLDDDGNEQDLTRNLEKIMQDNGFERFEYMLPDEYRLDAQLKEFCDDLDIPSKAYDTEHFITDRDALSEFFGEKNYVMENFYRYIRKKHGWLMDGKSPEGERWNYDTENRKSLSNDTAVVKPKLYKHDVTAIVDLVDSNGVETIGTVDPSNFFWPLDRVESLELLDYFVKSCLADFGRYQDAMHDDHWSVFHSRLSFSLNSKMLHPVEVVERVIAGYRDSNKVDIAAAEGFIRQIVGWREFMRGVYWAKMPQYANENRLNHRRHLPAYYWTADTKMHCMRRAIGQSLEKAYAHHIQRLMVTGNFALLSNVNPDEVDEWYLGIYIDAIQWVEMPNTRGMSQYADGGVVATKPYISSANYINKMSNYCKSCTYDHKKRTGENACPFNVLYWNFLMRHENKLSSNRRMSMMYRLLDKMADDERESIAAQADRYLRNIDDL